MKETLKDLYINQKKTIKEICGILNVSKKKVIRLLKEYNISLDKEILMKYRADRNCEKYGVDHPNKTKIIKEKISKRVKESHSDGKWLDKYRQTCINKYGVDNISKTEQWLDKYRQTCFEKYGVNSFSQTKEFRDKRYNTMKKNNSFIFGGVSKEEEQAYNLLIEKFDKENVLRQYKSSAYPFNCDFYIKSLDLYIEYNGGHFHNHCIFDSNNETHKKLISIWEEKSQGVKDSQYSRMIKVWTIEDPLKRKIAKENNLNWKEFFSLEELSSWLHEMVSN